MIQPFVPNCKEIDLIIAVMNDILVNNITFPDCKILPPKAPASTVTKSQKIHTDLLWPQLIIFPTRRLKVYDDQMRERLIWGDKTTQRTVSTVQYIYTFLKNQTKAVYLHILVRPNQDIEFIQSSKIKLTQDSVPTDSYKTKLIQFSIPTNSWKTKSRQCIYTFL